MASFFEFSLDDSQDFDTFAGAVGNNQLNVTPNGTVQALRTTRSNIENPQHSMTTYGVSDVMQGLATYKPEGMAYDAFNQTLSGDLGYLLESEGGAESIMGGRQPLLAYDILQTKGADDGIFTAVSSAGNSTLGQSTGLGGNVDTPVGGTVDPSQTPQSMGMENGRIPEHMLTPIGMGGTNGDNPLLMWEPAAMACMQMKKRADSDGQLFIINNTYRTFAKQQQLANDLGIYPAGMAAVPGTSNHGWGLSIDFNTATSGGIVDWLKGNAAPFGYRQDVDDGKERHHWTWYP